MKTIKCAEMVMILPLLSLLDINPSVLHVLIAKEEKKLKKEHIQNAENIVDICIEKNVKNRDFIIILDL